MSVTIKYGVANSVEKPLENYPTVSSILSDCDLRAFLGFGENVEAQVNGTNGIENLSDGDIVTIVTKTNTKG